MVSPLPITLPRSTTLRTSLCWSARGWAEAQRDATRRSCVPIIYGMRLHDSTRSLCNCGRVSAGLNFNVMLSQRGVLNLGHTLQDMRDLSRRVIANRLNGIDAELLTTEQVKEIVPIINTSPNVRYPILGASLQRRGGTVHHDAVAWGFARGADARGIDIIQTCEVTGIRRENGSVKGVETTRGFIKSRKVALAASGNTSMLAEMAGVRLPLQTHPLQAFVSEPVRPILHSVVMSNAVHAYVSQADKGPLVIGAGIDAYNGYGMRGSLAVVEGATAAMVELFPIFSRLRMNRQWAGAVDLTPDACPIIDRTPLDGLFVNCGWGTGGFKATPGSGWVYAHTIAKNEPHVLNEPFSLRRFTTGALIDEHGAAAVAH